MINNNAFGKSSSTIKRINNLFESDGHFLSNSPPNYDVWKMLNSLINVEIVELGLNVNEIPSEAFKTNLKSISIDPYNHIIIKNCHFKV